jgi:hypothetical protein
MMWLTLDGLGCGQGEQGEGKDHRDRLGDDERPALEGRRR